jgi:purine-binding chemotaxis protein CheW
MAKTQIYEQEQALSVYFDDMLAQPKPKQTQAPAKPAAVSAPNTAPLDDAIAETHSAEVSEPVSQSESKAPAIPGNIRLLLCEIDDIKLAFPVSEINNIVRWPQQGLTQIPDQADWQLGLFSQKQKNSQIIDIRRLLNSGDETTPFPFQAQNILLIDERRWGIACHRIHHITSYQQDEINWRQELSQRPWFTGVVNEGMYNIIDIPALLAALQQN